MQTETILQADVLDIIFEHRNKNYGAYELRKHYHKRLYKALVFSVLIIFAFYSLSFISNKKEKFINIGPELSLTDILPPATNKIPDAQKPEKPKEAVVKQKINTQQFTDKITITKIETAVPKIVEIRDETVISDVTETGAKPGAASLVKGTESGAGNKPGIENITAVDKTSPMNTAEIMPSYPGGIEALRKFLQKNLRNPADINEGEVVSVKIRFVVGYDGVLKSFATVEDGGTEFNNEVIRVLKKMPGWIPGKSRGENVSVYYTIPVKFISE